jgi:hypothetical protein
MKMVAGSIPAAPPKRKSSGLPGLFCFDDPYDPNNPTQNWKQVAANQWRMRDDTWDTLTVAKDRHQCWARWRSNSRMPASW